LTFEIGFGIIDLTVEEMIKGKRKNVTVGSEIGR